MNNKKLIPEEDKKLTQGARLGWALIAIGAAIVIGWIFADFSIRTIAGTAVAAALAAVVVYKNQNKK